MPMGFPGEGNGNPLLYSCWENSVDRGTWWATVPGLAKGRTRLSAHTHVEIAPVTELTTFLLERFWERD